MIEANGYRAFQSAAQKGHLEVIRYLEEKAPTKIPSMIAADNFIALWSATKYGHRDITHHLLSHPLTFAFAELHTREYGLHVNPFTSQKISALHVKKETLEQEHPNAVFDIADPNESKLLFYVLRNLIRRNEPDLRDEISFLLNIPSVKALAHTEVTPHVPNELLRLALTIGNQVAAELLLNIPAVRQLAEAANYYHSERRGRLDLRALAQNRESSMTALSQGEKERLKDALDRYQPLIKQAGIDNIMQDLKNRLETRYEINPAVLQLGQEKPLVLPFCWDDFQSLALKPDERKAALEAYAAHKDHTAWRYLSKPNPWMHEQAAYVYVNPNNHHEKWSTFEEYQPELCLYYIGAMDKEIPPTDGYTLETRLEGFIDELAHIGRAHNWDNQRIKINAAGDPLFNDDNEVIMEEYDDLERDKPSCFSGVKRRLFQSVRGHVLLSMLTKDTINEEIRDFVRQHVKDTVNEHNRIPIKAAWDKVIEGVKLHPEDWAALKLLDIPREKQDQLITSLSLKYRRQFTSDPIFTAQIKEAFTYKKRKEEAHVLNFGHAHPEDFFEENSIKEKSRIINSVTLFRATPSAKPQDNETLPPKPE